MRSPLLSAALAVLISCLFLGGARATEEDATLPPLSERFASPECKETPDFQRHVSNLMGRMGCNNRACHGSFQGKGGFRLSLFGYDFQADVESMNDKEQPRVDLKNPAASLIIEKPSNGDLHEGGQRYELGSWQHHVLLRWIEGGAKWEGKVQTLEELVVTPQEIVFSKPGEKVPLRAVAVWSDGTREDVTPICRFQSNNEQVLDVDENGVVAAGEPGDSHVVVFYDKAVVAVPVMRPVSGLVGDAYPAVATPTKVDEHVVTKLRKLGIVPSELATDAEFLRRVRLDMTGTLPTAAEVEAFLANPSANKRAEKIDALLETPEYAAWWTTKLCDFTGNNDQHLQNATPIRGRASRDWYDWIYKRVADNTPYDRMVEGIVLARSRNSGESYGDYCQNMADIYKSDSDKQFADRESLPHYWARRNFIKPEDRAIGFAYTFLGVRIQCAQCHKHPFDQWSKEDFADFQNFFTRVSAGAGNNRNAVAPDAREEYEALIKKIGVNPNNNQMRQELEKLLTAGKSVPLGEVYPLPPQAGNRPAAANPNNRRQVGPAATKARILGGESLSLNDFDDAREPLMTWLRDKENPFFARAFVNRVWASYFNVGIVNPPDDLSLANPPSNEALLDYLAEGFIASGFDMKWVHRTIANSRTYQLSWQPNETNRLDEKNFSRAVPRRLPAEVAVDAVKLATASDAAAETFLTEWKTRAIAIPGTGLNNQRGGGNFALTVFGRSLRDSNCDCDRSLEASLLQTVFLQNDNEAQSLISRTDGWVAAATKQFGRAPVRGGATVEQGGDRAALEKQIASLQERMREARQKQDRPAYRAMALEIAALEKKLPSAPEKGETIAKQPEKAAEAPQVEPGETEKLAALVRQAYLRTLSREPTAAESERSVAYLQDSSDKATGFRGLMWALVNTKEFIVNH